MTENTAAEIAGKIIAETYLNDINMRKNLRDLVLKFSQEEARQIIKTLMGGMRAEVEKALTEKKLEVIEEMRAGFDDWWKRFRDVNTQSAKDRIIHAAENIGDDQIKSWGQAVIVRYLRERIDKLKLSVDFSELIPPEEDDCC